MKRDFREFKIKRTCTKKYKDYKSYRPYLREDFNKRCAYCNLKDTMVTTPFEIDHYIPRKSFSGICDELDTKYENLIYSCKKCNLAKRNQFKGTISINNLNNEFFYDPSKVNYNNIFYRTEFGAINSDDNKGRDMIKRLELYRPIHSLGWLCEQVDITLRRIETIIIQEESDEKILILKEAKNKLNTYYRDLHKIFIANYNNKEFTMDTFCVQAI